MKIYKPKFWAKKNSFISISLMPISIFFKVLIFFKKKFTKTLRFKIPIICVGNIYLGGTGKTPVSILISNEINKKNIKPVIIKKFYKNHTDEHSLIKDKLVDLIIDTDRSAAIKKAEKENFDLAILDDGLQEYKIQKDLRIICFNENQLIGNGRLLPSGPLREDISSIKDAEVVIINGKKNIKFENKLLKFNNKLEIYYSQYKPRNLNEFDGKQLLALAGIGNPENFFKLLTDNKMNIVKKIEFPDHYNFSKHEIQNILDIAKQNNLKTICTEKDYQRIKDYNFEDISYLQIDLLIENKEKLLNRILRLCNENN